MNYYLWSFDIFSVGACLYERANKKYRPQIDSKESRLLSTGVNGGGDGGMHPPQSFEWGGYSILYPLQLLPGIKNTSN